MDPLSLYITLIHRKPIPRHRGTHASRGPVDFENNFLGNFTIPVRLSLSAIPATVFDVGGSVFVPTHVFFCTTAEISSCLAPE